MLVKKKLLLHQESVSGWWLTYPSENEFVNWDDYFPNIWKVIKNVPNQQPGFSQQPPLEFSTVKNGQRYPKLKGMLTTYSPSLLELKKESDFSKRTVTTRWLTVFWCFSTNCLRCRFTNPTLSWLLGLWEVGWSMFHVPVMVCLDSRYGKSWGNSLYVNWMILVLPMIWIPSLVKHTKNNGKSPFLVGNSTINGHFP